MTSKLVIVTGGTHGIGRASVEKLAAEGHIVLFTGRDIVAGKNVMAECENAIFQQCDVSNEADCGALASKAMKLGNGKIDGLFNCAGISLRADFHETTLENWDTVMATNTRSAYLITRLCLEGLIAARGSVVMTSSVAGMVGQRGLSLYVASKAALIGLTQTLALEYGSVVRFNAICPGQIQTRMMSKILSDPKKLAKTTSVIPASRLGQPHEVADVVSWLLSDSSSFVNGAIIPIDGGETAGIFE